MKRNWWAIGTLLALILLCRASSTAIRTTTAQLHHSLQTAYSYTEAGDYPQARQAFTETAKSAARSSQWIGFLVRRSLLDKVNETLSVLPSYANPDNQADLAVETARAQTLIRQLERSFVGGF